ncbi:unnamed protein product [Phytomonas sp. Hart1]|nr:unnamed protein product [Phytomonas sp. Hart1]|eukprot:CCW66018.1 unnamed protein product [Phytomonas sp. isolate Hart1]
MSRSLDPISNERSEFNQKSQALRLFPPLEKDLFSLKKRRRIVNNVSNGPLHSFGLESEPRMYSSVNPSGFFPETYGFFQVPEYSKGRNQFDISLKLDELRKKQSTQHLKEARETKGLLKKLHELKRPQTCITENTRSVSSLRSSSQGRSSIKYIRPKLVFAKFENPIINRSDVHSRSAQKLAETSRIDYRVLQDYEVFPLNSCILGQNSAVENNYHADGSLSFLTDDLAYGRLHMRKKPTRMGNNGK